MSSIFQYIQTNDEYGLIMYIKNNIIKSQQNTKLNKYLYKLSVNYNSINQYLVCDILQFIILSTLQTSAKLNIMLYLLSNGADPNVYNNLNETALSILFKYNFIRDKLSISQVLLYNNAKVKTLYYYSSPLYYLSRNIEHIKIYENTYVIYELMLHHMNFKYYVFPYCNSPLNILLRKEKPIDNLDEILLLINYYKEYNNIDKNGLYTYVYILRLIPLISNTNTIMNLIDKVIIDNNNITSITFIELFKVVKDELLLITILQKLINNYTSKHVLSNKRLTNILSSKELKTNKTILHYYCLNNNLGSRTLNYIIKYINKSVIYSADKNGNTPLHLLPFKNNMADINNINNNSNISVELSLYNDILLLLKLINYKNLNKTNKYGISIYYYLLLFTLSNKNNDYNVLRDILFNINYKLNKYELSEIIKYTYNNTLYITHNKKKISKETDNEPYYFNEECIICFNDIDKLNNIFLACKHNVCRECYYKLDKCPICRYEI